MKYRVTVARTVLLTATVEVDAHDASHAHLDALDEEPDEDWNEHHESETFVLRVEQVEP